MASAVQVVLGVPLVGSLLEVYTATFGHRTLGKPRSTLHCKSMTDPKDSDTPRNRFGHSLISTACGWSRCCSATATPLASWRRRAEYRASMASEHLRLMQQCGLLAAEREGRKKFYRVADPMARGTHDSNPGVV